MKRELNLETFHQVFSLRIEIAAALTDSLKASPDPINRLKKASTSLEMTIYELGYGDVEDQYRAFYTVISIFVLLAEWKYAIRSAESDAQRFLNSAKLKAAEVDGSLSFAINEQLHTFLNQVDALKSVEQLTAIQEQLEQWNLPLLLFANLRNPGFGSFHLPSTNKHSEKPEEIESTVAFLKFEIDGRPAEHYNYLRPGTAYDLTIEVRVSNWPQNAKILTLTPVTIDIRERHWLPNFIFNKPEGNGPFTFTGTNRAVLEIAHSFGSRPYEFLYAAEFDDIINCKNVSIIGHRRLILEGTDVTSNPLTGFSNIDRHLLKLRNRLRAFPGLQPDDIANTMIVLGGLGNIAAQALKSGIFEINTSEQQFQNKTSEMLRNRNDIGEYLQGHPEAAGGITDLTFKDIPIELKVENNKVLFPKDFSKYFNQIAAYTIGLGKQVGILSILESSKKSAPVGIVEDDIELFIHQSGQSHIAIIVIVIRGGFPKPSSYSR